MILRRILAFAFFRGLAFLLLLCSLPVLAMTTARADQCAPRIREVRAVPPAQKDEITLATQNLLRLFDDVDDGMGDVVPLRRYEQRLDKLSRQIGEVLRMPDVLAVQEVENRKVLADLALALAVRENVKPYQPVLLEGHDRSGIDVGFLVRPDWKILAVESLLAEQQLGEAFLFDRPPLLLRVQTPRNRMLDIVNVHLKSLRGSDDPVEAERVARKRQRQAEVLAHWLKDRLQQNSHENLVLLGDFNATPDVLGGVDVLGILQAAGLSNLGDRLPADERYTYVHGCRGEALDHVLVSPALLPAVKVLAVSRGNAGASWRFDREDGTALHSSDHDGLVLYLKQ